MADEVSRVAVYIDFDNIVISRYNQLHGRGRFQADRVRDVVVTDPGADPEVVARVRAATVDIGAILDYASSFGPVVISRAYADWSQPVNSGYRRQLVDRAIDLTQMFPLSATKNGADIRLAIDVVEDMFRLDDVTHVVLVAGDSDYVALAQRVQRLGRTIVAVGVAGATSRALPAACNDFSLYDDLPGIGADEGDTADAGAAEAADVAGVTAPVGRSAHSVDFVAPDDPAAPAPSEALPAKMSPRAATALLRRALQLGHDKSDDDDEWLHTSAVKQQIKRLDPSFHEKSLGFSTFSDFVKSRSNLVELDKTTNGQRLRMRRSAT